MKPDSPFFSHCFNSLSQSSLFKNLEKKKLTETLSSFNRVTWAKHSSAMTSSQTIHRVYVIISGRMKVFQIDPNTGRELTIFLLAPGDMFDVVCLLDGREHCIQTTAIDDLEALYAPLDEVRRWIEKHPEFNQTFLPYMGKQIRSLEDMATDLTFHDTFTRLAKLFLRHIEHSDSHEKLNLINDLSHEELANMIGSVRVVISRHMLQLKKDGVIHAGRKKIEIEDLHTLLKRTENRFGIRS